MYAFCVQLYMRFHIYSNRPFITYQKKMARWFFLHASYVLGDFNELIKRKKFLLLCFM